MDLKFNFLGLTVAEFDLSHHFYTETLGIKEYGSSPGWAMPIGWMDVYVGNAGMVFELFGDGVPPPANRSWGHGQNIRPSFQVEDLEAVVFDLRRRGVTFMSEPEDMPWARQLEFIAPDSIRWTLAQPHNYPASSSMRKPRLGWVEMRAHDLDAQVRFYTGVMGLQVHEATDSYIILKQAVGEPLLILLPGGERRVPAPDYHHGADAFHPIFLSFMTFDITTAARILHSAGVHTLEGLTEAEWGGTYMMITDPDGNPLQIVQYKLRGSFKAALEAAGGQPTRSFD